MDDNDKNIKKKINFARLFWAARIFYTMWIKKAMGGNMSYWSFFNVLKGFMNIFSSLNGFNSNLISYIGKKLKQLNSTNPKIPYIESF